MDNNELAAWCRRNGLFELAATIAAAGIPQLPPLPLDQVMAPIYDLINPFPSSIYNPEVSR
jgi:hypothetical protein